MAKIIKSMKNLIEKGGEKGMKMKKIGVMILILGIATMIPSVVFGFTFRDPYVGLITTKYNDIEWFIPGFPVPIGNPPGAPFLDNSEDLVGIFYLTEIYKGWGLTGDTLWAKADNNEELVGVLHGFDLIQISGAVPSFDVDFTGGLLEIYLQPYGTFLDVGTGGLADDNADGSVDSYSTILGSTPGVNGGETPFLTLAFVPGIDPFDPANVWAPVTLNSNINALTTPVSGQGFGYASISGGSHAGLFEFNNPAWSGADMLIQSNLNAPPFAADPSWNFESWDPVRGYATPEPTTLLLLGTGLLSLGAVRFMKRRRV